MRHFDFVAPRGTHEYPQRYPQLFELSMWRLRRVGGQVSLEPADVALLATRTAVGAVFVAHGANHLWGGGKVAGTARWFESLGMRPGLFHAWTASLVELCAGGLLILGFMTPFACAGAIGTMVVAWVTNHRRNGFFIFRPGEGYEYVLTLTFVAVGLAGAGPGRLSVDDAIGWMSPISWLWFTAAIVAGSVGAGGLLLVFWRPARE